MDRLAVADIHIGNVLAEYPEQESVWPPDEICAIIESIDTEEIKRGFSTAIYNKRGFSSRGPFDGGDIERNHAEHFTKLALAHKVRHPKISEIFARMAASYLHDAKLMDDEAKRSDLDY